MDDIKKQWAGGGRRCTHHVKEAVSNRLQLWLPPQKTRKSQFLRDRKCKQALADWRGSYVLVPVDKAGNNVVIVCKHFCIFLLLLMYM